MILIPAIDLIGGRVVRLSQGDYAQQTDYQQDPVELAQHFEQTGFTHVHVVDLDGARAGEPVNHEVIGAICRATRLQVDTGGGIKTDHDVQRYLDMGVRQLNIGSLAVRSPQTLVEWIARFGAESFILSADVRGERVAVQGWQEETASTVQDLIRTFLPHGLIRVTCTDISRDGMLSGPATELYLRLLREFPTLQLTASGGVSSVDDLIALRATGCHSAITGKALLEGRLDIDQLKSNELL